VRNEETHNTLGVKKNKGKKEVFSFPENVLVIKKIIIILKP